MHPGKQWYLVSYDVREPRRLHKVAQHLKGYGSRMQFSVFRCRLTVRELERLDWELSRILEAEDDLLIVALCSCCLAIMRQRGRKQDWSDEASTYEVI
ncbi:CRISPR-associated endonuclease Cas2 [bacterium]|nr:CRISPR-associated endonuclease Cas2 [bacterium]